jgi:hypothetical protein
MPVVFRESGYRFHFFSNEGDPREPVHIHVMREGRNAKFWLYPDVLLAYNYGFNGRQLAELERIVTAHRAEIEEAWNDHFT